MRAALVIVIVIMIGQRGRHCRLVDFEDVAFGSLSQIADAYNER